MPTLSIIIPTRERCEYLKAALESAIKVDSGDIEILVSDNASADETRAIVEAVGDPRVRYVNTGSRVSMRQNFEFAITEAKGDYFLMIGDDDAVIPSVVPQLIEILKKEKPDLVWWSPPLYQWPSDTERSNPHLLVTNKMMFGGYAVKGTASLASAMCEGTLRTQRHMPSIYHGCASRILMEDIKRRAGQYFGAQNPDCYVSFAGCLLTPRYIRLEHPISIAGASPRSNSVSTQSQLKFVVEFQQDPVGETLNLIPLCIIPSYLSTLIAAHAIAPNPPPINWNRWLARSVEEIKRLHPSQEARSTYLGSLARDMARYGQTLPASADQEPAAKPPRRRRGRLPSLGRIRVAFGQDSTVLEAVQLIEGLTGRYAISRRGRLERIARWSATLVRNLMRREA